MISIASSECVQAFYILWLCFDLILNDINVIYNYYYDQLSCVCAPNYLKLALASRCCDLFPSQIILQ